MWGTSDGRREREGGGGREGKGGYVAQKRRAPTSALRPSSPCMPSREGSGKEGGGRGGVLLLLSIIIIINNNNINNNNISTSSLVEILAPPISPYWLVNSLLLNWVQTTCRAHPSLRVPGAYAYLFICIPCSPYLDPRGFPGLLQKMGGGCFPKFQKSLNSGYNCTST